MRKEENGTEKGETVEEKEPMPENEKQNGEDTAPADVTTESTPDEKEEERQEQTDNHDSVDNNDESDAQVAEEEEMEGLEAMLMYETDSFVRLPAAGQSLAMRELSYRDVPNGCAICLCGFEEGDRVTWAANPDCPHAFHEDCVLQWMLSVGRKAGRRRERMDFMDDVDQDPVEAATDFPMLCPCCRQQFIHTGPHIPPIQCEEVVTHNRDSDNDDNNNNSSDDDGSYNETTPTQGDENV